MIWSCSIVNLGSMYGLVASYPEVYDEEENSSSIAYHSLKGGLINMTKHMAVYWAKDKIRVNCLSPGAFPKPSINSNLKDKLEEKIPIGNIGNPTQLQGPLLLLVSDAGSYITGHNLVVDGRVDNTIKYIYYMSIKNIYHPKNLKNKKILNQGMFLLRNVLLRKNYLIMIKYIKIIFIFL